jgi:quercetin dioxygenase-like cupin family protein
MKRLGRWLLVGVALAGVVLAFSVAPGGATPPSGLTQVVLARGNDVSNGTIPLQFGTDIVMVQLTVEPGGSSGWHSHPGGAIIVVKQGSITVHKAVGSQCQIETYSGGQAFLERPGEVDQVTNNGTIPYILLVTFPRVPPGGSPRIDQPDPGTCPGL